LVGSKNVVSTEVYGHQLAAIEVSEGLRDSFARRRLLAKSIVSPFDGARATEFLSSPKGIGMSSVDDH